MTAPSRLSTPPESTAIRTEPVSVATAPGLEVPERLASRVADHLQPCQPAAHPRRDRLVPHGHTEDAADHVGAAGRGEREHRKRQVRRVSERGDRDTPAAYRQRDRAPVPVHVPGPAARGADHHRPEAGRGVQQAEHGRAAQACCQLREHRVRRAEEHGTDVDEIGAEKIRPAFGITQPVGDPAHAWPVGIRTWSAWPHSGERNGRRGAGRAA